jgi:2-polyprenyl-3-methyl-5-hydroxy-6-metoxy-1,4-benzoquinol methylase
MKTNNFPIHLEYICCDLCKSNETNVKYIKNGSVLPVKFNIVECSSCGLVYVNPRPDSSLTSLIYTNEYYAGQGCDPYFSAQNIKKSEDANMLIDAILAYFGDDINKPIKLIEAGGGGGLITKIGNSRGLDCLMTDTSEDAILEAKRNQINAIHGELSSKSLDCFQGHVDVIVANEVIEHVYSPKKFLNDVHSLLRPGGLFVFTTGNYLETIIRGKNWMYMSIPDAHLYYFTKKTLDRYFLELGFHKRVDVYDFYTRNFLVLRVMKKLGFKISIGKPKSMVEKFLYTNVFKLIETCLFRKRFNWAVK